MPLRDGQSLVEQAGRLDRIALVEQDQRQVGLARCYVRMVGAEGRNVDRQRLPQELFRPVERPGELQKRRQAVERRRVARIGLSETLAAQCHDAFRDRHRIVIPPGVVVGIALRRELGEFVFLSPGGAGKHRDAEHDDHHQDQSADQPVRGAEFC